MIAGAPMKAKVNRGKILVTDEASLITAVGDALNRPPCSKVESSYDFMHSISPSCSGAYFPVSVHLFNFLLPCVADSVRPDKGSAAVNRPSPHLSGDAVVKSSQP